MIGSGEKTRPRFADICFWGNLDPSLRSWILNNLGPVNPKLLDCLTPSIEKDLFKVGIRCGCQNVFRTAFESPLIPLTDG